MRDLAEKMTESGPPVHFTTIAKIERSQRKLTPDWAVRFADAFGVAPEDIYADDSWRPSPGPRRVPVIGMVAAGTWREAVAHSDEHIPLPVSAPNAFALRVDGDSMNQVAPAGSLVMVDPDHFDLNEGSYYVVQNGDGEATFKRYRANPARLEPVSSNPVHTAIILGREPFSVIGKVVGVYHPLV